MIMSLADYLSFSGTIEPKIALFFKIFSVVLSIPVLFYSATEFFVLGDNRDSSLDSRIFGPIDRPSIVGRAWVRGWPFNRLQVFSTPAYN